MNQESLKIYVLNAITLAVSFTNLESFLKIVLLCISIVYTGMKIIDWIILKIKHNNENRDKEITQD